MCLMDSIRLSSPMIHCFLLREAEILPLLLSVLKALQNGSCDARRKAAERCLSELEAGAGIPGWRESIPKITMKPP